MTDFIFTFIMCYFIAKIVLAKIVKSNDRLDRTSIPFRSNINFGIYHQSNFRDKINQILGLKNYYSNDLFISCDYTPITKQIEKSYTTQNSLQYIMNEDMVHSIVCENSRLIINIRFKYKNKDKINIALNYVSEKLVPELQKIKDEIEEPIVEQIKKESAITQKEIRKNQTYLSKVSLFIYSFFIAIVCQIFFDSSINNKTFKMIDNISIFLGLSLGITLFIFIILYFWGKTKTKRLHLIYLSSFLVLLPACIILSFHALYASNYLLTYSQPHTEILEHRVRTTSSSRSRAYYYATYSKELNRSINVKISASQYFNLREFSKSQITIQKGALGYWYVIDIKPLAKSS